MGYGDYSFESLLAKFELSVRLSKLFSDAKPILAGSWLKETLQRGRNMAFFSEKSRSEFIVVPVLLYCKQLLGEDFFIYSGVRLDVEADLGLKGECDFILAKTPPTPVLRHPLMIVVEAKKNDIEEGMAQCAAQMIAARLFNEQHRAAERHMHGCVTTGEVWQFLRLQDKDLLVDEDRYHITEVEKVLGVLVAIMQGD
jgi:hypothetical protein